MTLKSCSLTAAAIASFAVAAASAQTPSDPSIRAAAQPDAFRLTGAVRISPNISATSSSERFALRVTSRTFGRAAPRGLAAYRENRDLAPGAAFGLRRIRTFTGGGAFVEAPKWGLTASFGVGVYGTEERLRRRDLFACSLLRGFEGDIRARSLADHALAMEDQRFRPGVSGGVEFKF